MKKSRTAFPGKMYVFDTFRFRFRLTIVQFETPFAALSYISTLGLVLGQGSGLSPFCGIFLGIRSTSVLDEVKFAF